MKPGHVDLPTLWRGCSYPGFTFIWLFSAGGIPIDLTNWTPFARSKNIDFHPVVSDAVNGVTYIYLTYDETENLPLGVEEWDWIWYNNVTGFVTPPLLAGTITIKQLQTKRGAPRPPPPPPPAPPNDNFAANILMEGLTGSLTGTTVSATRQNGEPAGDNSVWYRWRPGAAVEAAMHLNAGTSRMAVYTGNAVNALTEVAHSVSNPPALTFTTQPNTFYRIRVYKNTLAAPFELTWSFSI